MPRHITIRVSPFEASDNIEPCLRRLRNETKEDMLLYKARRYFVKPSERIRRETEQAKKRLLRPRPIHQYKEMGNQKMVRFTKQDKYV